MQHHAPQSTGHVEKQKMEIKWKLQMETGMEIGNRYGKKNAPITGATFSSHS